MTKTVGGVTSGYWATGSVNTATPPASMITMEITVAKIGRSMKKRDIMEFDHLAGGLARRGIFVRRNAAGKPAG